MNLNECGERLTELGNEFEDEMNKERPNLHELQSIMASYALYAGFLYGLAYLQNKTIVQARDEVRQTMDVIEGYLSSRSEDEK
jgi:hypothetical protein